MSVLSLVPKMSVLSLVPKMFVLSLVQNPIIVDVGKQPEPTDDISLNFVVGMFAMAGVLLAVAAVGCLIVAGIVVLIKRRRAAHDDSGEMTSHTRLKI